MVTSLGNSVNWKAKTIIAANRFDKFVVPNIPT